MVSVDLQTEKHLIQNQHQDFVLWVVHQVYLEVVHGIGHVLEVMVDQLHLVVHKLQKHQSADLQMAVHLVVLQHQDFVLLVKLLL